MPTDGGQPWKVSVTQKSDKNCRIFKLVCWTFSLVLELVAFLSIARGFSPTNINRKSRDPIVAINYHHDRHRQIRGNTLSQPKFRKRKTFLRPFYDASTTASCSIVLLILRFKSFPNGMLGEPISATLMGHCWGGFGIKLKHSKCCCPGNTIWWLTSNDAFRVDLRILGLNCFIVI